MHIEILRPMVKELAQSDLPFLSYGQKTVVFEEYRRKNFKCYMLL